MSATFTGTSEIHLNNRLFDTGSDVWGGGYGGRNKAAIDAIVEAPVSNGTTVETHVT